MKGSVGQLPPKRTEDEFFVFPEPTVRIARLTSAAPQYQREAKPSLAASPAGCRWGLCCLQEAQAMADERRSVAAAISGAWPRPEQRIRVRGSPIRATFTSACEIMAQW